MIRLNCIPAGGLKGVFLVSTATFVCIFQLNQLFHIRQTDITALSWAHAEQMQKSTVKTMVNALDHN